MGFAAVCVLHVRNVAAQMGEGCTLIGLCSFPWTRFCWVGNEDLLERDGGGLPSRTRREEETGWREMERCVRDMRGPRWVSSWGHGQPGHHMRLH